MKWISYQGSKVTLLVLLVGVAGCGWYVRTKGPLAQVSDAAPEFSLIDQHGEMVTLHGILEKGPAVIIFYRGNW